MEIRERITEDLIEEAIAEFLGDLDSDAQRIEALNKIRNYTSKYIKNLKPACSYSVKERVRENKVRRQLHKQGYLLRKSRRRIDADNHGGYMVVDLNNAVVGGSRFDMLLEDVENLFLEL